MRSRLCFTVIVCTVLVLFSGVLLPFPAQAQVVAARRAITQGIDEGNLITLRGSTRPEATAA